MSKFLRKAFPILVFYAAAGLVKIGLYYIADAFGMNTSGALFQLLVATFVGFFLCAICWQLGSLIKTKLKRKLSALFKNLSESAKCGIAK